MKKDVSKRMLICLYLIIGLLVVNTIFTISNATGDGNDNGKKQAEVNPDYDVSMMKSLNIDEVIALFDTKETHVVYIGRAGCPHCVNYLPTLQRAQEEFNYVTIKVVADSPENQDRESHAKLRDLLTMSYTMETHNGTETKTFGEFFYEYGYVPTTFIIKDGKMADGFIGGRDFNDFVSFLEKNGITR